MPREEMEAFSGCRIYDVVDDSLTAICQARLCPHVRWQPNYGVLADNIFHREDSSLIGILTFGRCTVAMGAIGCLLAFTLSMLWLIMSFFSAHARMALHRKTAFSVAGSMSRSLPLQLLQSSSVNTPSPKLVSWDLKSIWSAPCCRTSSVKVMALSKRGYILW